MNRADEFRSGFVVIIGRPNVGKSTLLNQLAKHKLAIISDKPQTTRHKIRAIVNHPNSQIIFVDTPGLHKPKDALGKRLNQTVKTALVDADVVLFLVDAASGIGGGDAFIAGEIRKIKTPVIAALNKIDLLDEKAKIKQLQKCRNLGDYDECLPISALLDKGLDYLVDKIKTLLPLGPKYYPEDMIGDQPEKVIMAEFIREKVFVLTREEIPYSVAVEIEEAKKRSDKDFIDVYAFIYVERASQKSIIIGEKGKMLKEIGVRARRDIERLLGSQIYLDLRVKVKKYWRRDSSLLDELGY